MARAPHPQEPIPYVERRGPSRRSSVPWKAVAAALVVIGVGFAATRGHFTTADPSGVKAAAKPPSAATVPAGPPKARADEPGKIEISSTPTAARVLLDGAEAGQTPVTLSDVAPGRRVITVVSSAGTVRRTVRVQPGKTVTLDVPVYSGFVNVIAPIILEVAVGGKSIGTTQQGRMLLPPGRHELTLSNRDLDYIATHMVEIESGEEARTRIEPRASVNINALPWAEVWVDGKRIGDTPLANVSMLLGTHTVVFKNPQYGEHSITTTIKATSPTELRHDFTKQ